MPKMTLCGKCLEPMRCLKTGALVRMSDNWFYDADVMGCDTCGTRAVLTATEGFALKGITLEGLRDRMGDWLLELSTELPDEPNLRKIISELVENWEESASKAELADARRLTRMSEPDRIVYRKCIEQAREALRITGEAG